MITIFSTPKNFEGIYKDGEEWDGYFNRRYSDGQLMMEYNYKNGKMVGKSKWVNEDGSEKKG